MGGGGLGEALGCEGFGLFFVAAEEGGYAPAMKVAKGFGGGV